MFTNLDRLRADLFWTIDTVKGKKIKNHLLEIDKVLNNFHSHAAVSYRKKKLDAIIEHVKTTVPYYEIKSLSSFQDFPLVDKVTFQNNFEQMNSVVYKDKKSKVVSTSGSTGTPFSIRQNENKFKRNSADTAFFAERAGYNLGEKIIYIKLWPQKLGAKKWKLKLKNVKGYNILNFSDDYMSEIITAIKSSKKPVNIIAYSSGLDRICKYLDRINSDKIECNMHSIITMSERLNNYTKERLHHYFGCLPVSRYSNNENGIIAQQNMVKNDVFEINWASYHIEMLDLYEDKPVSYGKMGRIVVTDLFNYAMPVIRYDTGDVGIMNVDEDKIPYLERVEGRKLDMIYDTSGKMVSTHISYHLFKYGNYRQFQFLQYGLKDYAINLNTPKKVENETEMIAEYKSILGQDANIEVNYVDEIPILKSGKRQEVANTFYK